jgi:hypothetical protein
MIAHEVRNRNTLASTVALALMLSGALGHAQEPPPPAFKFDKPAEVKTVEWKASTKAGFIAMSGNSQMTTFTFGGIASRRDPENKLQLDFNAAYARSNILIANDANANGVLDQGEINRQGQTTANQWNLKGRYDRFFTTNNSLYVAGLAAADQVAGKDFLGGGQLGYARQLHKNKLWDASAEIGYDLSYEVLAPPTDKSTLIQSGRLFLGGSLRVREGTALFANVEWLLNVNTEHVPWADAPADNPHKGVPAFHDNRLGGKVGLTTKLWRNLAFSFSFAVKYDQSPAPRPAVKDGAGNEVPFAVAYSPFVGRTDTITEAALIISFL